jgi:hypothetical protein
VLGELSVTFRSCSASHRAANIAVSVSPCTVNSCASGAGRSPSICTASIAPWGAILYGTLPFDAGVPTSPARLAGVPVFRPVTHPVPVCGNGQIGVKSGGTLRQYGYSGSGASMLAL